MAGPGDPPEGNPEGSPGGGEDEYRSVVFDESFVRAARIQEFSARERLDGSARSVRTRRLWARGGAPRQALVLVLLIAVAFGTAVYLGIRNPYDQPAPPVAQSLQITLLPLAPTAAVAAVDRSRPFAGQRAEHYRAGGTGYALPPARRTAHFSESQVMQALVSAKEYLVASSADPDALTGGDIRTVRTMLDPGQLDQFDRSLERPADDGRHAATGWLVRFDPARVALADDEVKVRGSMTVSEAGRRPWRSSRTTPWSTPCRPPPGAAARPRCSPCGASCGCASTARTCATSTWNCCRPPSRPGRCPA